MAFDPEFISDERTALREWLTYQRESCIAKLDGLTDEQARWKPAPGANSMMGIVTHLGHAEHWWFHRCFANEEQSYPRWGDPADDDYDFKPPDGMTIEEAVALYRAEIERSNAVERAARSLDAVAAHERRKPNLRWIMVHMIEETARHAGHMDITRELIDGSTGML
jgi:uncharacterized damage-inducible protein DinB